MAVRRISLLFAASFFVALAMGCSSTPKDSNTPEGSFKIAEDYENDEMYDESLTHYADVKNRFPYSRYAVEAELKIADVNFKREAWIEAQNNYQLFKDLHPKHPKIAYVTHRLGLSYFNQLPSTIDRDLSVAEKAITSFDELTRSFPTSEFVEEAKKKRLEARKMLGEKVLYIAQFYFIRDIYDSALLRYEKLLNEFSGEGFGPQALFGAGTSAMEVGERSKGEQYLSQLIKNYPASAEADKAPGTMKKYGIY